jgi:hypothetical protein
VLEEMIAKCLADESEQGKRVQMAVSLGDTISEEEAEVWQEAVRRIRDSWQ